MVKIEPDAELQQHFAHDAFECTHPVFLAERVPGGRDADGGPVEPEQMKHVYCAPVTSAIPAANASSLCARTDKRRLLAALLTSTFRIHELAA
jgi:hypothetical protein